MSMYALLPCMFGIEAALKNEVLNLGYQKADLEVEDGLIRVSLGPDWATEIFRLNLELRTAERVRLELFRGPAEDFDSYFDLVRAFPWQDLIRPGEAIIVNGSSRKSKLYGISALQSLAKKAIVERLAEAWGLVGQQLTEDRDQAELRLNFAFNRDQVTFSIDTSGPGLHKRGYRPLTHAAPLRETLAAAILYYAHYDNIVRFNECLYDPFCGSGTFLIEAASILTDKAPGLDRKFALENLSFAQSKQFAQLRAEARERWDRSKLSSQLICGSDLSAKIIAEAGRNIDRAGFADLIDLRQRDILQLTAKGLSTWPGGPGLIVANPPYGERLGEVEEALELTQKLVDVALDKAHAQAWKLAFVQALDGLEKSLPKVDKRRKLYNGSIPVTLYQFFTHARPKTR